MLRQVGTKESGMSREFGICFAGLEEKFERYIRMVAEQNSTVVYMEIGVASGQTLVSVAEILRESGRGWTAVGIDLPEGYSLERSHILARANARGIPCSIVEFNHCTQMVLPKYEGITVYLKPSQQFLQSNWEYPLDFVLIDGCHCKNCVMDDFKLVEPHVTHGGIVAFHDFGQDSVGEPQPHGDTGDTLGACLELGLTDGARSGWRQLDTIVGDKNNNGRDLGVFQRL
jgi:predicted O-methyltransferase YrrM